VNRSLVALLVALPLVACVSQEERVTPSPTQPPTNSRDAASHVVIYVDGMT